MNVRKKYERMRKIIFLNFAVNTLLISFWQVPYTFSQPPGEEIHSTQSQKGKEKNLKAEVPKIVISEMSQRYEYSDLGRLAPFRLTCRHLKTEFDKWIISKDQRVGQKIRLGSSLDNLIAVPWKAGSSELKSKLNQCLRCSLNELTSWLLSLSHKADSIHLRLARSFMILDILSQSILFAQRNDYGKNERFFEQGLEPINPPHFGETPCFVQKPKTY